MKHNLKLIKSSWKLADDVEVVLLALQWVQTMMLAVLVALALK